MRFDKFGAGALISTLALAIAAGLSCPARAADLPSTKAAPEALARDPWTGFYVGGNIGYAWGNSHWATPGNSGSVDMAEGINTFNESGSFFTGLQAGYNYLLPNHILIGAEADLMAPTFPNLAGNTTGGGTNFTSPTKGPESYSVNVQTGGTARARVGYASGDWLFYATGGLAWSRDLLSLTQISSQTNDSPLLWRLGWAAGAGVEFPVTANWTGKIEYLFKDFGAKDVYFPSNAQQFSSGLTLQQVLVGLNYHFGNESAPAPVSDAAAPGSDRISLHGQATFVEQAYPAMRAPYNGPYSLPNTGQGRETFDLTLYTGLRLWQGAEFWVNPEVDQGFGLANTHGAAGFPSAEAYKLGDPFPYARVQRYFVRQTIDLGGETQKVDADVNVFAGSTTANRLVLTVGKFGIVDIFDTNKFANNPKTDFLNWSMINTGTFDYAGDAWGYSYGAAAEWYQDRWTLRVGAFDLSQTPAGGALNALAYGLDPNFSQFQLVGEIEERHELWGQAGKFKITGFVSRGRAGQFQTAVDVANATGIDPSLALALDRQFRSRPGMSFNTEQQVTETVGVFARAGWVDGNVEPWDFADIDRTVQAGVSVSGKQWGRPDDTWAIAGVLNGITSAHQAYFNAGGLGILIGDGQLPNPGSERIIETYYNYALTPSTKLGLDYQFIANPGYNTQRGPANIFAGRVHWTF